MEERSMTQAELEMLSGVKQGVISRYLRNIGVPKIENLMRIAQGLRVPISAFLDNNALNEAQLRSITEAPNIEEAIKAMNKAGLPPVLIELIERWRAGKLSEVQVNFFKALLDLNKEK